MRLGREQQQRITTALRLIEPMGEMIELMHRVILAHPPADVTEDDCPVCGHYAAEIAPTLQRWADAHAKAAEWAE